MSRSERIAKLLGMSHGAAAGKLRKLVLFKLAEKCGDNICIKCRLLIETADDLSIEHIRPWEGRSAELFWDLDNISFSHARCNRPHVSGGPLLRKIGPNGTSWCGGCREFLSTDNFSKNKNHWNGLSYYCSICKPERRV